MKPRLRPLPTNISFSIPYDVMVDTRLKLSSRVLFSEILAMSIKHGYCYAQNAHFVEMLGISHDTVARSIKELEETGYITVKDSTSKKRQIRTTNWQKIKPPQKAGDAKHTQNADVKTPKVRKKRTEPTQIAESTDANCDENQIASNHIDTKEITSTTNVVGASAPEGEAEGADKPDRRNPDINLIVEAFQTKMELVMPKQQLQRRYAQLLIKQKCNRCTLTGEISPTCEFCKGSGQNGVAGALRAIDAVVLSRRSPDAEYAPKILDLATLYQKWNDLVDFYRRHQTKANKPRRTRTAT